MPRAKASQRSVAQNAFAMANSTERVALVALYEATTGSAWPNNTGWLTGDPCSNPGWFSVGCNSNNTPISIGSGQTLSGLVGTLPPALLGSLASISLPSTMGSNANLSGTLPTELNAEPPRLNFLDLENTALSGTLPTQLGQLALLQVLVLDGLALSGSIPTQIGLLGRDAVGSALGSLDLFSNRLSGQLPSQLGLLHGLAAGGCELTNTLVGPQTNFFFCPATMFTNGCSTVDCTFLPVRPY